MSATLHMITPAESASAITPSDSARFAPTKGVFVGASGDLHVLMANGDEVTFADVAGGVVHPLSVTRIYSTDTTATDIIALY